MRRWTGSSLVQIMACRLLGAKPLPEPMLVYCRLDSWEQVSVKFKSEFYHFHSRKCIWKCLSKWQPFCPGEDELMLSNCCWITHTAMIAWCMDGWMDGWMDVCVCDTVCFAGCVCVLWSTKQLLNTDDLTHYIPMMTYGVISNDMFVALTHWGRDKMAEIFQMTFSDVFSWMKMFEFLLKFHLSLFLRVQLTIFQYWFK